MQFKTLHVLMLALAAQSASAAVPKRQILPTGSPFGDIIGAATSALSSATSAATSLLPKPPASEPQRQVPPTGSPVGDAVEPPTSATPTATPSVPGPPKAEAVRRRRMPVAARRPAAAP